MVYGASISGRISATFSISAHLAQRKTTNSVHKFPALQLLMALVAGNPRRKSSEEMVSLQTELTCECCFALRLRPAC